MAITVKDLLEAGCHFGHQTKRWNPKMKDYVYGAKNGISIIDLTKTIHQIGDACNFLQSKVMNGARVLFVGTKRQAQQIVKDTADATGMYYMAERWMGGTLTNLETIKKSVRKMRDMDAIVSDENANYKKKEIALMQRDLVKLHRDLDGIADMRRLPDLLVVIDISHDDIAVREANKLGIPVIAICDTNANPELVDYPVAANDDAVKSIKVIIDTFAAAIKDASELYQVKAAEEKAKEEEEKAKAKAEGKDTKRGAAKGERAFAKRPAAKRIRKDADGEAVEKTAGNPEEEKKPRAKRAPRVKKEDVPAEVKSLSEIKEA